MSGAGRRVVIERLPSCIGRYGPEPISIYITSLSGTYSLEFDVRLPQLEFSRIQCILERRAPPKYHQTIEFRSRCRS